MLIFIHHCGFIRDRHISDCVILSLEAINMLDRKQFGGNLALKVDILKAFDTLGWDFLMHVLYLFGFNQQFCNFISTILHSSRLSILVNRKWENNWIFSMLS